MSSRVGAISLVVITRNRWPNLRGSLPRHEAPVVVDNGSTDGAPEQVRRHFPHGEAHRIRR